MSSQMRKLEINKTVSTCSDNSDRHEISIICLFSDDSLFKERIKKTLEDEYRVWALDNEMTESAVGDFYLVDAAIYKENETYLKELKELYSPELLPVLVFSVNSEESLLDEDVYEFADDIILLPQQINSLKKRIKMLIRFRGITREMVRSHEELDLERKKLIKEKEHHALITNNSTDVITLHERDGTYKYISPSVKKVLGYAPEELIGTDPYDTTHPDDIAVTRMKHEKLLKTGITVKYTHRKKNKKDDFIWVETILKPVRDNKSGNIIGLVSNSRDISKRVILEHKLKEEKDFVDYVADNMPGTFYMLDENLNFKYWNKHFIKDLGYSEKEIEKMSPYDLFDKEGKIALRKQIKEAFKKGKTEFTVDLFTKSKDKRTYFIEGSCISNGHEKLIVGFGIDITERVKAQYESSQQKQLMEAIINQSDSVIYVKNSEGEMKLVNQAYLDIFGLNYDEASGLNEKKILAPEIIDAVRENDQKVFRDQQACTFEEKIQVNGEWRIFHSVKYPLKHVAGLEDYICGISTDITNKIKLQYALEERVKENKCLLDISELLEKGKDVCVAMKESVKLIPKGFQYPENTEARIIFGDHTVETTNFRISPAMLESKVVVVDSKLLQIQVALFPDKSEMNFLGEELAMINSICDSIRSRVGRIITMHKLQESEQRWENLVQNDPDLIMIVQQEEIKYLNKAGAKMYEAEPEDLIGKKLFEIINIENVNIAIQRMNKVQNGDCVEPYIHKIIHPKTNEYRYLQIQSLPIRYKGVNAIQIVGTDLTTRITIENELRKSLSDKEVLLQEVHHRVKNNLAVVSGLLQIQLFESDNEDLKHILTGSVSRIKSMALIHERLYQTDSLSDVNFLEYTKKLVENIVETLNVDGTITIKWDIDPTVVLNLNQAVPCALIMNELITNSIKHAWKVGEKGTVKIMMKEENEIVTLKVTDNGIGLPEYFLEKYNSMGVTILKTLVGQLKGDISAYNNNGASVTLIFKKREVNGSSGNKQA